MRKRTLRSGLLCLPLLGCGGHAGSDAAPQSIECAIGVGADWTGHCPVERNGALLTVRHVDGGFRRFRIIQRGHALMPADGSEESSSRKIDGNRIELSIGEDRYRLPLRFNEALK
ncbi:hypothetical protein [Sphingobium sp. EM0848]|uniref:hypothetical protein n=1 Tax=Sphingobium sp. EM0848 TaxID=2743473 RepID=UPI00159C77B4|nr:hypothetical protein [Sphingobium sp. EM0848]